MKRHILNIDDLKKDNISKILLAAHHGKSISKRLYVIVDIIDSVVFYEVMDHEEFVIKTTSLEDAIEAYNEI
jgi:hypothetical protein